MDDSGYFRTLNRIPYPIIHSPFFRLVNQIVTMHQNAKETNEELKVVNG